MEAGKGPGHFPAVGKLEAGDEKRAGGRGGGIRDDWRRSTQRGYVCWIRWRNGCCNSGDLYHAYHSIVFFYLFIYYFTIQVKMF